MVLRNAEIYLETHHVLSFSEITRYEVVRGLIAAGASSRLKLFESFCGSCEIVPMEWPVLERAAQIWADLRRQGTMIDDIDILVAASALYRNWAVVTHNTKHFKYVAHLILIDWTIANP